MNNIFITGEIGIGKTTSLNKILDLVKNNIKKDFKIGGYKCIKDIKTKDNDTIITYSILSLSNLSTYKIIEVSKKEGHRKIYPSSFDDFSPILYDDLQKCDFIVLDEIGFAESNSQQYLEILNKTLDDKKVVLGILKKHPCDLIKNIKSREDCMIFDVNKENRNFLYKEIYHILAEKL